MTNLRYSILVTALLGFVASVTSQDIDLRAQHVCNDIPGDKLSMMLRVYDTNNVAKRMHAIDNNVEIISTCSVSGAGTVSSPYTLQTTIDRTDESVESNDCGMTSTVQGGQLVYTWRFKVYAHLATDTFSRKGFILTATCDNTRTGYVETLVEYDTDTILTVTAQNPTDVTGLNSIATNANIRFTVDLYPGSSKTDAALRDAKGIYLYNCLSSTSANMVDDQEFFIDGNGCPVDGVDYEPGSGFTTKINTGDRITMESGLAIASVVNGEKTIYIRCSGGVCTTENDIFCSDRCAAHANGETTGGGTRFDTGTLLNTVFTVENIQAQSMYPARPNGNPKISHTNVNSPISIVTQSAPFGIGADSVMNDADGFFVYGCRYSLVSANMENPVPFVDDDGCKISGTNIDMVDDFFYDSSQSVNNVHVVRSGRIHLDGFQGNNRMWVKCQTGICTVPNHNYCTGTRCGATNNVPTGTQILGDRGFEFTLSIIDPVNIPALNMQVVGPDGRIVTTDTTVDVGDSVDFGVEVTPGGTDNSGNDFSDAQGIYIHSCVATTASGIEDQFIDENGCRAEGSKYQLNAPCRDVTSVDGVPPFSINCGGYVVQQDGDITTECQIGYCTTSEHPFCEDRCLASINGISPENTAAHSQKVTSSYKAVVPDLRRTAERSEEIDTIIIAVTIVAALFVLAVVCIGTFIIVRNQRRRAKNYEDTRSFNY